jgi:hypothetical protein
MASRNVSIQLSDDAVERLDAHCQATGQTLAQLARTLLEEWVRVREHPGIFFQEGPAGRRPKLLGGPDVWEVARVFNGTATHDDEAISQMTFLTGLHQGQIRDALRYYAAYQDEIDDWIRHVDDTAERGYAEWKRKQALLHR